jgi:5'-nucleotidase
MRILLTNDDGIFAPGLAAMERALGRLGEVQVAAPSTEQSGVGHAITFLTPLTAKEVFEGERHRGWAVDGSPADAVKLAIAEFCPARPDLVVSGINSGLNAGINVLYSGTVAAARGRSSGSRASPCRSSGTTIRTTRGRPRSAST